ncbi:efflux transporter outer membrane subunit [Hydrocarboniphaga sp.]|uniref:efflux transporter outer membrane subunit n=1 Tax=Hydrocarboniphaga sp. TaxID=2033016 RepID=UPI003D0BF1FF
MIMQKNRYLPLVSAALFSAGCTMIPDYQRPEAPLAAAYESTATAGADKTVAADIGWREFFTDPQLRSLIETALNNNRDLRVAALNVESARAQYRIQRAALLPTIDASGSESVTKYPAGVVSSGAGSGADTGSSTAVGTDDITRTFTAGVGITAYEVDLFGRIRSLNAARLADYLALEQTRRSTQISLVAEVANAYFALIADQRLLTVTRTTLESQQSTLELSQKRLSAGATDALTVRQVEQSVFTAKANLAQYTRQLQLDRNALTQLLGLPALPADLTIADGLDEGALAAPLAPGLPSELLTRRPDVLAAEQQLVAANANIGAARAAFFPSISLTGSYGTASTELDGLFDKGSTAWSFAPSISVPIFSGGANVANLDAAKVQKNIGIAQYEGTIQTAFREVADALASRATLDDELIAQQGLVDATSDSLKLAGLRFDRGVDSYLTVLDSQRSQFAAQQTLEKLKLTRLQNLVTLYKVLGGGWTEQSSSGKAAD